MKRAGERACRAPPARPGLGWGAFGFCPFCPSRRRRLGCAGRSRQRCCARCPRAAELPPAPVQPRPRYSQAAQGARPQPAPGRPLSPGRAGAAPAGGGRALARWRRRRRGCARAGRCSPAAAGLCGRSAGPCAGWPRGRRRTSASRP